MFPEADAFLDAIFEQPDDDTPRLVYADWLEEHGQANYAQFIRLQCAAAREKLWSPEANRLWEEIGRVWTRLAGGEWRDALLGFEHLDATDFHRGFPRQPQLMPIGTAIERFSVCGPAPHLLSVWFDQHPPPPDLDQLGPNQLDHLRVLKLSGLHRSITETLLVRPRFLHLKVLDLRHEWVTDALARLLLAAKGLVLLPGLTVTVPTDHDMSNDMVAILRDYFGTLQFANPD